MNDETINRLSETLNQYAASSLSSVSIPEFKGLPGEDVYDFLRRFKLATLTFNPDLKCMALNKALVGSAHTWARASIKRLIHECNWKECKRAIIERFAPPDQELRHQERLHKLAFNPETGTLLSYIEEYADCYRKARGPANDHDIIRSLTLNLPADVMRHLNLLSDDWNNFTRLTDLFSLIKRYETKILPYERKAQQIEKVEMSEIASLLREMRETIKAQREEPKQAPKEDVAAAAVRVNNQNVQPNRYNNYNRDNTRRPYHPYNNYELANRSREPLRSQYNQRYNTPINNQADNRGNASSDNAQSNDNLKADYEARFGKPPGPCQFCGGYHFNRHCPYKALN